MKKKLEKYYDQFFGEGYWEKQYKKNIVAFAETFIKNYMRAGENSGSLLSFEQCLREEFLVNTQNYPKEYHQLFRQKFERAERRFKEQSSNDR